VGDTGGTLDGVEPEQEDPGFPHAFCPQVEQVNFVLLLGPLRSSGRRALSRSPAPSARRLLRRHGRLENDPDRVRALVSVSRRFGRRVAPELERGFFSP